MIGVDDDVVCVGGDGSVPTIMVAGVNIYLLECV